MENGKVEQVPEALRANNFAVYHARDAEQAHGIIMNDILPALAPKIVSYGDSETLKATGVLPVLKDDPAIQFIDTFEPGVERGEILQRRREALLSDVFFLGANAVTADGRLVNLDMVGNRVAGIVYGPLNVVVTVGTNKIVPDMDAAIERIQTIAAPKNAARHGCRTPCVKTGECMNCKSPDRICNVWTVTDKSWPKGRISVVMIDGDYGL